MKLTLRAIFFLLFLSPLLLWAQEKKIDFFGSGRFALNNSNLSGELLKTDTVTPQKQMTGAALFDLGFHIRPNEETEIKALTRVSNDINGFWGGGITFYLRELYLRGLMFKKIKYQVGDLNTRMTPYTLYNFDAELSAHNPLSLNTFSEVIQYDKFYGENSWRQQGALLDFGFDFNKVANHLKVKSFISKNRQTDYFSTPDRLFSGTSLEFKLLNQLKLNYNLAYAFDVKNSAMFSQTRFSNTVNSFGLNESVDAKFALLNLSAEFGQSKVQFENQPDAPLVPNGSFADLGLELKSKKKNWNASANYRSVESSFRSMGAQSRRIDYTATATQYPYYTNKETPRPANLLDILTDGNYYQMFLRPELKQFNPAYENMLPYGKATPNRQGMDAALGWNTTKNQLCKLGVQGAYYNEINGEGTLELRNFTQLEAFADLGLNHLYQSNKKWHVGLYMRMQNTQRAGTVGIDKVDLKTTQYKVGMEYEIIPKLELQIAGIWLHANGNEFLAERNAYNEIVFFKAYNAQLDELSITGGINYQFSKRNCLKIQWQQANWDNLLLQANQYKINRVAVLYNLFF